MAAPQGEANTCINDIHLQKLQREIDCLRSEVIRLKNRRQIRSIYCPRNCFANGFNNPWGMRNPGNQKDCEAIGKPTEAGLGENRKYTNEFIRTWGSSARNVLLLAAAGSTVTTSPFLGLRSAFDASDLIVNLPTMNEDLRFLKEHVLLDKKLKCYGLKLPDKPIIILGGKIEAIAFLQEDNCRNATNSDIDLSTVRLDVLVEVSRCVHAFMALNMDTSAFNLLNNSSLDIQLAGGGSRVSNSRVFVTRAFVTVGDLDCLPFYFTIGQMFVPFGRYASNMVTSTLTQNLGRTNERAILFGFYKNGLYGSVYAFKGESNINAPGINQWGTNWGFEKSWDKGSLNIGAGYIANIADATRFQVTGASKGFLGFGIGSAHEILAHRVPAYDVHGEFSFGKFNLFSEYIWTSRGFDIRNLSFNGHGASPTASNLELAYNFKIATAPASVAIGYGTTSEAFALNLPKSSFLAVFNVSIWKNTIESIEFRHDKNYDICDFAGGNGAIRVIHGIGGSRNTYTAQIGVYF